MSNPSLLKKAREILTHTKQAPLPGPTTNEARDTTSMIESAAPNTRPVYWETGTGQILGPAVPEFLMRVASSYWIVTTFGGQIQWINADRLRSRKAFEEQATVREVELIHSF